MNTLFPELENSHLSSTDKQWLQEEFAEKTKQGRHHEVTLLKQQVQEKSEAIYRRWQSCNEVFTSVNRQAETPGTTPQVKWFLAQLECSLQRALEDFMDENCDDFDIGLELMNEHLNRTTNRKPPGTMS